MGERKEQVVQYFKFPLHTNILLDEGVKKSRATEEKRLKKDQISRGEEIFKKIPDGGWGQLFQFRGIVCFEDF